MNTSFLILQPYKLLENYAKTTDANSSSFYGLVKSYEIECHLQSFLVTFPIDWIRDENVIQWWYDMRPINERSTVIKLYEIGLSQLMRQSGYILRGAYEPLPTAPPINPCHFHYMTILEDFGILKIELIRDNPFKQNLASIIELARVNSSVKKSLIEGLEN